MQNTTQPSKNKRLRKKLFLDEFAITGFDFSCQLSVKDEAELDALFDNFIKFIESRYLCVAGDGDESSFEGFITSMERYGSATEDDRTAIKDWLSAQAGVTDISIGELEDAIYGA